MRVAIVVIVVGALSPAFVAAQSPSLAASVAHERSRSQSMSAASLGRFISARSLSAEAGHGTKPSVRCGMTLLRADPRTDSAIRRATPDEARFAIRAVRPALCGDDSPR